MRQPAVLLEEDRAARPRFIRLVRQGEAAAPVAEVTVEAERPVGDVTLLPGIGPWSRRADGALRGLVETVIVTVVRERPADTTLQCLISLARSEPNRYAADLMIYREVGPGGYAALAARHDLPSDRWGRLQTAGALARTLAETHRTRGEQLLRVHGTRPFAKRVVLGLAAATGMDVEVARALDNVRRRPTYVPQRSFHDLVRGLSPNEVAAVASACAAGDEAAMDLSLHMAAPPTCKPRHPYPKTLASCGVSACLPFSWTWPRHIGILPPARRWTCGSIARPSLWSGRRSPPH